MSGADPNEHASYCAICDRPNYDGFAICNPCNAALGEPEDAGDERLSWESAAELAYLTMMNGNLTDGINLIMYDGDVRADSVKAALRLLVCWTDNGTPIHSAIGIIIRVIEKWETQ
jgi:hypothetical protein